MINRDWEKQVRKITWQGTIIYRMILRLDKQKVPSQLSGGEGTLYIDE
jgi:hypothetical protein